MATKQFIKIADDDTAEVKQGKEQLNLAFNALDAETQKSLEGYKKLQEEANEGILKKSTELENTLVEYKEKADKAGKAQSEQIEELKQALVELNKSKVMQEEQKRKNISDNIFQAFTDGEKNIKSYMVNRKAGASIDFKAVTMGVSANAVAPFFTPIVGPAHELEHARDFIPVSPTISNLIRYVKFTSTPNLITVTSAPGVAKQQIDYSESVVDAPVIKLAGYIRVADEFLEDIVGSQDWLTSELTAALYDAEDQQIFMGTGNSGQLAGLYTNATAYTPSATIVGSSPNDIDKIAAGAAYVRRFKRKTTAAWVSPEDYLSMLINKSTGSTIIYTYPINFNANTGMLMIGDIPIIQHTVFAPGQCLLGDFARGARLFQKADATLAFSTEDGTNFTQNLTTVRVEERIALANFFPESFVKLQLNATYS